MSDTEDSHEFGGQSMLRKTSKHEDTESLLRNEMEKEDLEIEALRAKAEERRRRQEEDLRRQEEEKARIEAEKRAKEEEEKRRREEAAQKKRQQELDKLQAQAKNIKEDDMAAAGGSKLGNVLKAKEDMTKSPEQLEQEKREIIASRLVKLDLDRKNKQDLIKAAEDYFQVLMNLHSQIYDLNEKYDRQKYDMMELAERARQIEKGKAKTRKSNIVHTGLGGSVFPWLGEVTSKCPQKISLFSRYERVTDRRTFKDRRDIWAAPKEEKPLVFEKPKAKLKNVDETKIKQRRRRHEIQDEEEEQNKEEHHEEEHHEEEHHEEEHHEEEHQEEEHNEEEEHHEEAQAEEEAPADDE